MLERYGMSDCQPVLTPMTPNTILTKDMGPLTAEEIEFMCSIPYLSAIGTLQYLATMTRADIAYVVALLACFSSNLGPKHWQAVKHLFCYLKGTLEYQLTYSGELGSDIFTAYCDAAHGDCKDSECSIGGYLTMMVGGAIGWSSKLQGTMALFTTKQSTLLLLLLKLAKKFHGCTTFSSSLAWLWTSLPLSTLTTSQLSVFQRILNTMDA